MRSTERSTNVKTTGTGLDRREFLATGTRAGMAGAVLMAGHRMGARAQSGAGRGGGSELHYLPATVMASMIRRREVSAREAVDACIRRIEAVNPKLNALVMACYDRARAEARMADERQARGERLGALHGVPMSLKDSIDSEGVVTTGCTLGRKGFVPGKDATVTARLRAAGAILVGKTNTPEFTMGSFTDNLVYGRTNNPYDLTRIPGGSSGGSGAIVAAGGVPFDLGSDTGGSIRSPCHYNGVAGIKPTNCRVPRTGHIVDLHGIFNRRTQIGPLARTVSDVDLVLRIIMGSDDVDTHVTDVPLGGTADVKLKGLRVAFYTDTEGYHQPRPETVAMVKRVLGGLEGEVASITESAPPAIPEGIAIMQKARAAGGGSHIQRTAKRWGTETLYPTVQARVTGKTSTAAEFTHLLEEQDRIRQEQARWFRDYDVIVCPTQAYGAPLHGAPNPGSSSYRTIYNLNGWPAGVVRAGTSPEGMPMGIQVIGHPWREDVVFAVMAAIESMTGGWKAPAI
ncbi:MAG: amidase [Verrucomicrobiae bacterium]|nr:amidase [Verrucomicrobiae bacterium]